MSDDLREELHTFDEHRAELLRAAENAYVLIHGSNVIDTFDTEVDAIKRGYEEFGNVAFLVKKILRVEHPETFVSNLIAL